MSEQIRTVSKEEFRAIFPPQSTEQLIEIEAEVVADYEERAKDAQMLAHIENDLTIDPMHALYFRDKIAQVDAKLKDPYGRQA